MEIAIAPNLKPGDRKFLLKALTEVARRPSGRAMLKKMIDSPTKFTFTVGDLNEKAKLEAADRRTNEVKLVFGETKGINPITDESTVTIDKKTLARFSSRTNPRLDAEGVNTSLHEIFHANDLLNGKTQDEAAAREQEAEDFAQNTRKEKRTNKDEATALIIISLGWLGIIR